MIFNYVSIFILEKIRKLIKSLSKKNNIIQDYITYFRWKIKKYESIKFDGFLLNNEIKNYNQVKSNSVKLAICICFFFKKSKIKNLKKICENFSKLNINYEITIITNDKSKKEYLSAQIKAKKITIHAPTDLIDNRLLPWVHLKIMKKKYLNKSFTHFLYIEDDILVSEENIKYWILARQFLKKINLIPSFILTEFNSSDKNLYAVSYLSKNKIKLMPKILDKKNFFAFANTKFPYQAMYLYDRSLMKEHIFGPSSNPDFGHGAFKIKYLNKNMINLDLMAKVNAGLIYKDVPFGFLNRYVLPVNLKTCRVNEYCLIKHLPNKYIYQKTKYGKIKVDNIFY